MATIYLDCNATTTLEEPVREVLLQHLSEEFGNEGSRTHEYGLRARKAIQTARTHVASLVAASREDVVFTSGATESNNLAILGLRAAATRLNKPHFITSQIEHKAVVEPFNQLEQEGFLVTRLPVGKRGWVEPSDVKDSLRPNTMLVSIMHANNETGIKQPIQEIADVLLGHDAYFHTDAAQGFGKDLETLRNSRIDLISASAHKIYGPQGVGALIIRKRDYQRPPLSPLLFGGSQERGLRPGTLPVALIAAFGEASKLALERASNRQECCLDYRKKVLDLLIPLGATLIGDQNKAMPHVLNFYFNDIDAESLILALKDIVAISNGSACTSTSYHASHVLKAMGMTDDEANRCVRMSWSHMTKDFDKTAFTAKLKSITI